MKKALLSFICAFFALTAYGAYDFQSGGLYYTITSSTNMTVKVSYNSNNKYTNGVYAIPNQVTYNGKTYYVTGIGSYAFSGCTALTTITFDENTYVKTIEDHAFSGCNAMSRITIPANVTSIGNYAFSGCFTLKFVTIEDATTTLSLGHGSKDGSNYGLFADTDLRSFYWGRPLKYDSDYGRSPIANLSNLSEITIGPNVSTLSPYMFSGNVAITSFELPATVTSLGEHAFHGFKGLTSFTIPQQITTIGDYAFAYCTGLTSLTIPEWVTTIGKGAFAGCTGFKSFVVPNSVQSIGNLAFSGCTSLTGVVFEEGEESLALGYNAYESNGVGKGMFYDCPLQSVFIGRTLNYSYYSYNGYKYSDYPGRFGYSPFANNTTLTKAHFGNPVKSIPAYLFTGCTALTTLQYNSNCKPTSIGKYAFWSCRSLTETDIVYPESVNTIGEGAFRYCTSLEGYTIPNHITTVGSYAFQNCEKLASIVVKPSVTSIGNLAFSGCTALTGVVFEESEESLSLGYNTYNSDGVGKGMFYDCPLQSVFIGRPLNYSYYNYNNYKYSDYPSRFGYSPFANNATLTKAHFGNPVKAIQLYLFYGCKDLTTLEYNADCKPTVIESYAFAGGCKGLTSIDIPATVTTINKGAFKDCEKLTSIVIKPTVTGIGNLAFSGCTSLTGVVFEESEESLSLGYNTYNSDGTGKGMFYDCPLQSVFIGRPLNYSYYNYNNYKYNDYPGRFGYSPFANNTTLTKAHFGNPVKTIPAYLFTGCTALTTLQYNSNCKPTSIGKYAFWSCRSLTEPDIVYPESVNTIGDGAFRYCTSLEGYTIPNHITTVGSYAFQNCEKLASIVVKPSVTSIGNGAFNGCTSLTGVVFEESEESLSLGYNTYNSDGVGKGMFYDCPLQSVFIGRPLNYSYYNYNNYKYSDYPSRFGYSPFANNATLTKAHFGNPVEAIQLYLFYGCKDLTTLEYDADFKPTTIEKYAFAGGCKGLTSIDIPATVTTIGTGAFKDSEKLTSIVIKPTVTSIGNLAFSGCTSLTGVVFEESEESLSLGYNTYNSDGTGKGMFYDCPLQSVFIGRPLNYSYYNYNNYKYNDYPGRFGYSPFANNTTLTKAHFGNPVKAIQLYLFAGCTSLTTLQYNSNCKPTSIEKYAFWTCKSLTETDIVYPESVNTIGDGAFRYCTSLEGYTIPNHITTVGSYAFQNCEKLASVVVNPSVTSIGNGAFNGCTSLTGVVFEESEDILKLGYNTYNSDGVGKGMFYDCPLQSVFIGRPLNYSYYSYNNYKYSDYPSRFGRSPFANNATLTEAHLGNPVKAIQLYLFYGCKELTTMEYDADFKPTAIEKYAFAGGCKGLTSIDIPATVTSVGDYAFQNCTSLTDVSCHPVKVPTTKTNAFNGVSVEEVTLHVPATSVNSYKATEPWKNFIIEGMADDAKGDVNGDGDVDIADAVCIVNYVVGKPNTTFNEAAADANGDGDIDIADAVHIVNYVVGKIPALAPRFEMNMADPE